MERTSDELRDQLGATATECAMLMDMLGDAEEGLKALELLTTIAFYTYLDTGWKEVIGKQFSVEGFDFGLYHNGAGWVIDELSTGKSIGMVTDWRLAELRAHEVVNWKGPSWLNYKLHEEIQKQTVPRPADPRVIPVWREE
ncbi:hypothetical protein [Alicyclobacillus sp. ALC3]|uniref:hypothetical protein n=1 Tax=Alicyclobacillus sp. ALC3 TaxID=2796143 RepID=UPI002378D147|nr:hypothetical protein [Alicyclobacillus sp. ALC3]WDL97824.1 hypothetical protein JC200_03575 [Alicyclobacillus sp. ALC3]